MRARLVYASVGRESFRLLQCRSTDVIHREGGERLESQEIEIGQLELYMI
jgi:hypothetical protein